MLRTATAEDWRLLTGRDAPAHWIGLAYDEAGTTLGLGGAYEGTDGRWWAAVISTVKRPVALYRAAKEVLETAADAKVPLYAVADLRIEGAQRFLLRLGFTETNEIREGHRVYKWTL